MTDKEIQHRLKAVIMEQFNIEEQFITAQTSLADDLGADSMSLTEMLTRIEDAFEVEMPDLRQFAGMRVGDLVAYLSRELASRPGDAVAAARRVA